MADYDTPTPVFFRVMCLFILTIAQTTKWVIFIWHYFLPSVAYLLHYDISFASLDFVARHWQNIRESDPDVLRLIFSIACFNVIASGINVFRGCGYLMYKIDIYEPSMKCKLNLLMMLTTLSACLFFLPFTVDMNGDELCIQMTAFAVIEVAVRVTIHCLAKEDDALYTRRLRHRSIFSGNPSLDLYYNDSFDMLDHIRSNPRVNSTYSNASTASTMELQDMASENP